MAGTIKTTGTTPTAAQKKRVTTKHKRISVGNGRIGRVLFAVLVTLAVAMLGFFLLFREQGNITLPENAVGSLLTPLQNAASSVTRYVRDTVNGVRGYFVMSENYEIIKQENERLTLQLLAAEEQELENVRLRSALNAKERYQSLDPVFAHVTAREPGPWFDNFTIDVGEDAHIQPNMAVVVGGGLVGRVNEVGRNYAKVVTIINVESGVACLVQRARGAGVMHGRIGMDPTSQECRMNYLTQANNITPGDVVITSGTDGVFPKGILVGTVTSVSRQSDLSDNYVVVNPYVDFTNIEEVMVLRTVPVESEQLPALATPTPAPTPDPTPTPDPGEIVLDPVDDDDQVFIWPEDTQEPGLFDDELQALENGEYEPEATFDPETMPLENLW